MDTVELKDAAAPATAEVAGCAARTRSFNTAPWLVGVGGLAAVGALFAGWDWVVAAGLATTVLAVAPCLAMCALGLCMGRGNAKRD